MKNESYTVACELLKERYARPVKIIFPHIQKLLKLGSDDGKDLKVVQDMLLLHIRRLETWCGWSQICSVLV